MNHFQFKVKHKIFIALFLWTNYFLLAYDYVDPPEEVQIEIEKEEEQEEADKQKKDSIEKEDPSQGESEDETELNKIQEFLKKLIRPKKTLLLDNAPLPLRVEAKILAREIMNFVRWKRPDIAEKKLKEFEKLIPESEETFYLRGVLQFTYGNWDEAEVELLQSIHIHPKHDPALFLLGCVYGMKKDWQQAASFTERALQEAPYSPYFRMNLAYYYFLLEEKEKAYREIQTTIQHKPNHEGAIFLGKLMGYSDWDKIWEEWGLEKRLDEESKEVWKNGFPNLESKVDYFLKRIYCFFPITRN